MSTPKNINFGSVGVIYQDTVNISFRNNTASGATYIQTNNGANSAYLDGTGNFILGQSTLICPTMIVNTAPSYTGSVNYAFPSISSQIGYTNSQTGSLVSITTVNVDFTICSITLPAIGVYIVYCYTFMGSIPTTSQVGMSLNLGSGNVLRASNSTCGSFCPTPMGFASVSSLTGGANVVNLLMRMNTITDGPYFTSSKLSYMRIA